jgi:hypothetical protein
MAGSYTDPVGRGIINDHAARLHHLLWRLCLRAARELQARVPPEGEVIDRAGVARARKTIRALFSGEEVIGYAVRIAPRAPADPAVEHLEATDQARGELERHRARARPGHEAYGGVFTALEARENMFRRLPRKLKRIVISPTATMAAMIPYSVAETASSSRQKRFSRSSIFPSFVL